MHFYRTYILHRTYILICAIVFVISAVFITSAGRANAMTADANTGLLCRFCENKDSRFLNWHVQGMVPESPGFKSKSRARLYSAGYTVLPIVLARGMSNGYRLSDQSSASVLLIASGIIAGPSGGSIYADDWNLARRSIIIRSVSAAFIVSGYLIRDHVSQEGPGLVMMVSGGLFMTGHALYDILFLSAHSVDYYNMRIRLEAGLTMNNPIPVEWREWAGFPSDSKLRKLPELAFRLHF